MSTGPSRGSCCCLSPRVFLTVDIMTRFEQVCRYIVLLVLATFFASSTLVAQANVRNFYLYNVDTSAFPRVTANVYALDNSNQRYKNLAVTDFDLFENGSQRDATMTLNCDTSTTPLPIAVCLALDQSFSMANKTPAGDTYWDWVKAGARAFIDSLRMTPPTCVAVTSFGGTAYVRAPFQTTKPPLYAALDQIPIEGGTNYDEAFLNLSAPSQSAAAVTVLRNAPAMLKRFIIILTDGQPDRPPSKQRIIDSCVANGITVYAINLYTTKTPNINVDLQEIATKTNGRAFLARSKADLVSIYRLIVLEAQRNIDCRLSWLSTPGCTQQSRLRTLRALFRKGTISYTWNGSYTASFNSLANPIPSVTSLSFSDPGSGNKVRKTITVRAPQGNTIRIDRFVSNMPGTFAVVSTSKTLPCTLSGAQTIDVTVEFTQTVTGTLHKATLTIQGSPCSQTVALNVIIPILKLETPIGGEVINGCDSIPIRWSGIAEDETITVMYSRDNSARWNVLENNAFGLNYKWFNNVEHDAGTQTPFAYKVKIQRSTPKWLVGIGGSGTDKAVCLTYGKNTGLISVGGSFDGTMVYGSNVVTSSGGRDAFLARLNLNGVPRSILQIGGSGDEEITAVASDSTTNTIVVGTTNGASLLVGDSSLKFSSNNRVSSFIAMFDSTGKTRWAVGLADTTGKNLGEFRATGVIVKADSSIVVEGYISGVISSVYSPATNAIGIEHDAPDVATFPLTVEISKKGVVTRILDGFFQPTQKGATTAVLVNNDSYQIGTFAGSTIAGKFSLAAQGSTDGFVRAVTLNPGTDQSAKSFRIQVPLVIFEVQQLDLPSVEVGTTRNFYVGQPMRSAGSVSLELSSLTAVGLDSLDFTVDPPLAPGIIQPFSSPEVRISVSPQAVARRQRFAYLVATAACSEPAFIRLRTYATFPSVSLTNVDFGRRRIGSIQTDTIFLANSDAGSIPLQGLQDSANASKSFLRTAAIPSDSILPGKTILPLVITFNPKQIAQDSLVVRIDSSGAVPVSVRGTAKGSGFLPRCASTGFSFKPVIVGTTSTESAFVTIANIDTIAALRVYSNNWFNSLRDDFDRSVTIGDTTIAVGDTLRVPVSFAPKTPGFHSVTYVFEHDAAPGPAQLPRAADTVVVEGDAVAVSVQPTSVTLPTILRCDSAEATIRVSNLSSRTDVTVSEIKVLSASPDFSVSIQTPFTIGAGNNTPVRIVYHPTTSAASAQVVIVHDGGAPDTVSINASSVTASLQLSATDTSIVAAINDKLLIGIRGELLSASPFLLDTISIVVQTNPSQARFATERFIRSQEGWQWNLDSSGSSFLFHGSRLAGNQSPSIRFMNIPFDVYLSPTLLNTMRVVGLAEYASACLILDTGRIVIQETPVCFLGGSTVQLTSPLALSVQQRSAALDLFFTVPVPMNVSVDMVTPLGSVLHSRRFDAHEGKNTVEIPISNVPSGVYFCRIVAENTVAVQGILVVR